MNPLTTCTRNYLIAAEEIDKAKLTQKRTALNEKKNILRALDDELLPSVPDVYLEDEIESSDDVQERIPLTTIMISKVCPGFTYISYLTPLPNLLPLQ